MFIHDHYDLWCTLWTWILQYTRTQVLDPLDLYINSVTFDVHYELKLYSLSLRTQFLDPIGLCINNYVTQHIEKYQSENLIFEMQSQNISKYDDMVEFKISHMLESSILNL